MVHPSFPIVPNAQNAIDATNEERLKLKNQLEYYFSDENLERDTYLVKQIREGKGYVSYAVLMTFSKIREMNYPRQDFHVAIEDSNVLESDPDLEAVCRRDFKGEVMEQKLCELETNFLKRAAMVSGFPLDVSKDDLDRYLENFREKFTRFVMRREKGTKSFRGSVYINFKDIASLEAFMNDKGTDFYNNQPLKKITGYEHEVSRPPNFTKKQPNERFTYPLEQLHI